MAVAETAKGAGEDAKGPWNVTVRPGSTRLYRGSRDTPRLMGRKLNYVFSFRPINIGRARKGDERAEPRTAAPAANTGEFAVTHTMRG